MLQFSDYVVADGGSLDIPTYLHTLGNYFLSVRFAVTLGRSLPSRWANPLPPQVSAALAIINIVPAYYLDGQVAVRHACRYWRRPIFIYHIRLQFAVSALVALLWGGCAGNAQVYTRRILGVCSALCLANLALALCQLLF